MAISYMTGDLLAAQVEAVVNPVNIVGIMGKGLALVFKNKFPDNFRFYREACEKKQVCMGKMLVFKLASNPNYIINFPTKKHWRDSSKLEDIRSGLVDLRKYIEVQHIRSVAIPALGCGLGGLSWLAVKALIEQTFDGMQDCEILVFPPQ